MNTTAVTTAPITPEEWEKLNYSERYFLSWPRHDDDWVAETPPNPNKGTQTQ